MAVKYGGVSLESISDTIHVIDVVIGSPGIDNTTIQPALMDGDIFARSRYNPRSVSITFVVMERDMEQRRQIIRRVYEWARSREQKQLELPQEPDGYLMAVCSSLPDNAAREYWQPIALQFTADDPYFQAKQPDSTELTNGAIVNVQHFDNPHWWIEQTIPAGLSSPMWGLGSVQISFIALPAGRLEIRRDKQTADVDGRSALPSMFLGSRFFDLKAGPNVFSLSGDAGGTIYWRERWL